MMQLTQQPIFVNRNSQVLDDAQEQALRQCVRLRTEEAIILEGQIEKLLDKIDELKKRIADQDAELKRLRGAQIKNRFVFQGA